VIVLVVLQVEIISDQQAVVLVVMVTVQDTAVSELIYHQLAVVE
jgi:hypothetical protein